MARELHFTQTACLTTGREPALQQGMVANLHLLPPEAREIVEQGRFNQDGLWSLAAFLPEADDELHALLETLIETRDEIHFSFVICAATLAGRALQASLLARGTVFFPDTVRLCGIAWRMQGDVTGNLVAAIRGGGLGPDMQATALFIAAAWWQKHHETPVPGELIAQARSIARNKSLKGKSYLAATQMLLHDPALETLLPFLKNAKLHKQAEGLKAAYFKTLEKPFADFFYETEDQVPGEYKSGLPVRRTVERIGRNEHCPCGSGKKYKRCCEKKDTGRRRHPSSIAGKTAIEAALAAATPQTLIELQKLDTAGLVRVNPALLPASLLQEYAIRLCALNRFDELAAACEKLSFPAELQALWKQLTFFVVWRWQRSCALRLVAAHPRGEEILSESRPGMRILIAAPDEKGFLAATEREATSLLEGEPDEEALQDFAQALLASPWPALGIFVTRSILPLTTASDMATFLFEQILAARDRLNLSLEDAFSDFMDERALRAASDHDSIELEEVTRKLAASKEEERRTKEERARLEREVKLLKHQGRRAEEKSKTPSSDDTARDEKLKDLSRKIDNLSAELTEKSKSNLEYRRQTEKLTREIEAIRTQNATHDDLSSRPEEDEQGEAITFEGNQPVRLIQFPKDFAERLAEFPQHARRAAMKRIGLIAAGDKAGFDKIKQLKAYPGVLRARVSDKFRLFFTLTPESVRVVDLIWRDDLDRWVKQLVTRGLPPLE